MNRLEFIRPRYVFMQAVICKINLYVNISFQNDLTCKPARPNFGHPAKNLSLNISFESNDPVPFMILTLTRPLRRNLRMRWFFDVSKLKESSFF